MFATTPPLTLQCLASSRYASYGVVMFLDDPSQLTAHGSWYSIHISLWSAPQCFAGDAVTIATLLPTSQRPCPVTLQCTKHISSVEKVTACYKSLSARLHLFIKQQYTTDDWLYWITHITIQMHLWKPPAGGLHTLGQACSAPGTPNKLFYVTEGEKDSRRQKSFVSLCHQRPCRSTGDFSNDIIHWRTHVLWTAQLSQTAREVIHQWDRRTHSKTTYSQTPGLQ